MIIDVLITNTAKPETLQEVMLALSKNFIGKDHTFRFVLLEYRIGKNNRIQQQASQTWLRKNKNMFDEVILINRSVGSDLWFKDMVNSAKSDYFMHIKGNTPIVVRVLLDVIIAIMVSNNEDIPQIVFNNGEITDEYIVATEEVDGLKFGELNFFSKSAGVYNTKLVRNIFSHIEKEGLSFNREDLAKAAKELGYVNYVLADRKKHLNII